MHQERNMTIVQRIKAFALILGLSAFGFAGYAAAESEGGRAAREMITGIFGQIITSALQSEQGEGQEEAEAAGGEEEGAEGTSYWED
jgi:hypothetical protein